MKGPNILCFQCPYVTGVLPMNLSALETQAEAVIQSPRGGRPVPFVLTEPGAKSRNMCCGISSERTLVKYSIAALLPEYMAFPGTGMAPSYDPTFTTQSFLSFPKNSINALVRATVVKKFFDMISPS